MPCLAEAQGLYCSQINSAQGLPADAVYNVFQDSKGFLWIASEAGLSKYDGFTFNTYKSEAITSAPGSCIKEDKYGRIWYENFDGYIYYLEDDTLKNFNQKTPSQYCPFGIVGNYLFTTRNSHIDIYNLKSLKLISSIPIPVIAFENAVNDDQLFYIICDHTIYSIDTLFNINKNPWFTGKDIPVKQIYTYDKGIYIVSKHNETNVIYTFDKQLKFKKTIPIPDIHFIQSSNFLDNRFWLHTPDGSYQYLLSDNNHLKPNSFFRGKSISGVIKDRQNNYWFTTIGNGLLFANSLNDKLIIFNNYQINKLTNYGNSLLAGTQSGEVLKFIPGKSSFIQVAGNKARLKVNYLSSDQQLIFCSSNKLSIINNNKKIKDYELALKHIVKVDSSYYFMAVSGCAGLFKNPLLKAPRKSPWDKAFNKNINFADNSFAPIIKSVRAKSVAYDNLSNMLFCATNIGLYAINTDTVEEVLINRKRIYPSTIECYKSILYSLNSDGNVYQINPNQSYELLNRKLDLAPNSIKWIKLVNHNLYLINNLQVLQFNLTNNKVRKLSSFLNPAEITDIESNNGSIFLATASGIVQVTESAFDAVPAPLFHLNYAIVNDSKVSLKKMMSGSFEPDKNNISFNFSILDYGHYNTNALYYRLNDGEWEKVSPDIRTINFPSLSPGRYTISFRLANTAVNETYHFEITKPFWQKWWFYLACSLPVYLLSYFFYRRLLYIKTNKLKEQNEKMELEQNLNRSILASIRSQMNPHFFYNALNTIQAYIFTNDKLKASSYLAKFSKLTRMILQMSDKELVVLEEEIEALTLYLDLEKMRFGEDFEYSLSCKPGTDLMTEIPSMIIQPYAENAIKHGLLHKEGVKKLDITFEVQHNVLEVTVEDNGIGRIKAGEFTKAQAERYKSFSTSANEKRIDLLNKGRKNKVAVTITDKTDSHGQATGTKILLKIPLEDVQSNNYR